ncbi:MAG: dephospho-CoA kinase [Candidatus Nanopelagicales bacterium]
MRIGLTGGIGAGKSAVSTRFAAHGAVVVDADTIAREVVEPGTPGLAAIAAEFGTGVLAADGSLDRAALAAIVFADPERRAALEAIVHPLVAQRSGQLIAAAPPQAVVVYDVPLLVELVARGQRTTDEYDHVVVVEAPEDVRIERLVARGLPEWDAEARIASQATDEERRAVADHVIVNDGTLEELDAQVDALWSTLTA